MSVLSQQDTPGNGDSALEPLATRACISCFVHAMAKDTVLTAFGEHAAFHIAGVCNCSVSEENVSRISHSTDHLGNRHRNTSPSLCGKFRSSGKCLEFPVRWSIRLRCGWTLLFGLRCVCKRRQSCEALIQERHWEKTSPLLQTRGQQKQRLSRVSLCLVESLL